MRRQYDHMLQSNIAFSFLLLQMCDVANCTLPVSFSYITLNDGVFLQ